MSIKYQYALDSNNNLININELSGNDKLAGDEYHCLSCLNTLIPKLGKIRAHHFSHKTQLTCSTETYLHKLSKRFFFDTYNNCLKNKKPFLITICQNASCDTCKKDLNIECKRFLERTYNLIDFYDVIEEEVHDDQFIPDILLKQSNGNDRIYIEFLVTHKSVEKKLDSGTKIIEITIENESDISKLKSLHLRYDIRNASFFNFKNNIELKTTPKSKSCFGGEYDWFVIFDDKTTQLTALKVHDFFNKKFQRKILFFKLVPHMTIGFWDRKKMHNKMKLEAIKEGHEILLDIKCPTCLRKLKTDILPGYLWCSWCGKGVLKLSQNEQS